MALSSHVLYTTESVGDSILGLGDQRLVEPPAHVRLLQIARSLQGCRVAVRREPEVAVVSPTRDHDNRQVVGRRSADAHGGPGIQVSVTAVKPGASVSFLSTSGQHSPVRATERHDRAVSCARKRALDVDEEIGIVGQSLLGCQVAQ